MKLRLDTKKKGSRDEVILTLTERKTRKEVIVRRNSKTTEAVMKEMKKIQKKYGSLFSFVFLIITYRQ